MNPNKGPRFLNQVPTLFMRPRDPGLKGFIRGESLAIRHLNQPDLRDKSWTRVCFNLPFTRTLDSRQLQAEGTRFAAVCRARHAEVRRR